MRRPDPPTLVAGLGLLALGGLVLADALDAIALRFAVLGPVACAVLGATLLAAGLARRD
jgi:Ca2+/Na+ antiporter